MANTYQGPANGTASYNFGGAGVEVSVAIGQPSLSPCFAPYVDPSVAISFTAINKAVAGTTITIANPA
jgi:hypothetical protein